MFQIKLSVLLNYIKAMGSISTIFVFVCVSLFQGLNIFSNFWLTYWTEDETLKNISLSGTAEYEEKYIFYLLMYLLFGVLQGRGGTFLYFIVPGNYIYWSTYCCICYLVSFRVEGTLFDIKKQNLEIHLIYKS